MWKTQRKTARGWEPEHELPTEDDARQYWAALESLGCMEPMRLIDGAGMSVGEMNTGPTEKGSDDEQLQTG